MFIQFSVENFLSFKDQAVISMIASKRRSKDKSLDENSTFEAFPGIKLLKTAVIYGANGSGKSNLFKAIGFMKNLTINSSKESQADEEIDITPFLVNTCTPEKPSKFEIIFILNETMYQYEFSVSSKRIEREKLISRHKHKEKDKILFERNNNEIKVFNEFPEGKGLEKRTRDNALFVSVCANFDGEISGEVIRWFRSVRVIRGLNDQGLISFTKKQLDNPESSKKIKSFLKAFDLGIENLKNSEKELPNSKMPREVLDHLKSLIEKNLPSNVSVGFSAGRISTEHRVFNEHGKLAGVIDFDLEENESEGTKKLIALSGPFINALEKSLIIFMDEFDARLHPIISQQIIKIFNSSGENTNNSQLVVISHDTNLLDKDLLRRDQIWFTEKDIFGASHLTSLLEYRVRNDASFEKDYIAGKYGAIPFIGKTSMLISSDEQQ